MTYQEKVKDFLDQRIIAIAGVSRNPKTEVGNAIYKKLKTSGYTVYPINPFAESIDGDKCYPSLNAVPKKPDAVFITTNPSASVDVVEQCIESGISRIWFHRSFGTGSFSEPAAKLGDENGLIVIRSGCPMMFIKDADLGHRMIAFFMKFFRKLS
ncbi:MAG: CoA-binding protein [Ignavibacteriae bacterium HGW-Ignavibacteriae-3]|nr:MAG: CoA-binding protein [Ignavibacteriae bacterium HGW-Ignavibacteriae-3]